MPLAYTIEINNESEVSELENIAASHGWQLKPNIVTPFKPATTDKKKIQELQQLFINGGDVSNYGDAAEWQSKTREDRPQPFRH